MKRICMSVFLLVLAMGFSTKADDARQPRRPRTTSQPASQPSAKPSKASIKAMSKEANIQRDTAIAKLKKMGKYLKKRVIRIRQGKGDPGWDIGWDDRKEREIDKLPLKRRYKRLIEELKQVKAEFDKLQKNDPPFVPVIRKFQVGAVGRLPYSDSVKTRFAPDPLPYRDSIVIEVIFSSDRMMVSLYIPVEIDRLRGTLKPVESKVVVTGIKTNGLAKGMKIKLDGAFWVTNEQRPKLASTDTPSVWEMQSIDATKYLKKRKVKKPVATSRPASGPASSAPVPMRS